MDDGALYVYHLTGEFNPLCKTREPGLATNAIKFFNNSDTSLIAAHSSSVCLWTFDVDKRNI